MLSYTQSRTLYGQLTNNSSSANLSFGDTMINEGANVMLGTLPWPFLEATKNATTVSGTQTYTLPGDLDRLTSVYIMSGTYKYTPDEVTSFDDWNQVNNPSGVTGDNVSAYFILGNTIQFWPIPASNGNTIVYEYVLSVRDTSVADYTTGTITTATNGSAAIVGTGTAWTAGMAGKWIRITSSNAVNSGDGLWYQILSVGSATTLTLSAVYTGASITAGTTAYIIGDFSVIPGKYQNGPVYYAAAEYWRKQNDDARADRYQAKFEDVLRHMKNEEGTKTSSVVVDSNSDNLIVNPNLNKLAIG
jgi:hypothetical protein